MTNVAYPGNPGTPRTCQEAAAVQDRIDAESDRDAASGPQPGDAGISADGQELVYEPDGWTPVPDTEPEAGG